MKKFSLLKESKTEEVKSSEINQILSTLSIHTNVDLTDKDVQIVGLDSVKEQLYSHVANVKQQTIRQTVQQIEESLKSGQNWNIIIERLVNEKE